LEVITTVITAPYPFYFFVVPREACNLSEVRFGDVAVLKQFSVLDGTVMMAPENLLAFVDEVKMTAQLETPGEGLMNIAASFPSVMKPRFNRPVGESQYD
jgi:hypothetical protein